MADARGLKIHSRISSEIPQLLLGDANRLRQVLINLTGNAIKFTEQGNVSLAAAVDTRQGNSTITIRFSITDTGIGLRPDQVATLFSPFVQADSSTTRKYGGTGLGLSICKQIAGLMGGTIGVDSQEGQGSTFWFTAVFEVAPTGQEPAATERVSARFREPRGISQGGSNVRILLAEDSVTNREVALAQLQKLGYNASVVTNGSEALGALRQGRYDLVLMDCEMPVMDGLEATRVIRTSMQSAIPIIALTAGSMRSGQESCLAAGMNDFLSKPTDLGQLADMIAKWLPESSAEADNPSVPISEGPASTILDSPATIIFDVEGLLRRLMGDRTLAGTIVQGFLKDAPDQLNNLRARLVEADAHSIQAQAHTLNGAAAVVGAEALQATAKAMQSAAMAGCLDQCSELLPRIVEEFERYRSTLERTGWL